MFLNMSITISQRCKHKNKVSFLKLLTASDRSPKIELRVQTSHTHKPVKRSQLQRTHVSATIWHYHCTLAPITYYSPATVSFMKIKKINQDPYTEEHWMATVLVLTSHLWHKVKITVVNSTDTGKQQPSVFLTCKYLEMLFRRWRCVDTVLVPLFHYQYI